MRLPPALLPLVLLAACAEPEPAPGVPVPLAEVCRTEHDGQRVATEGYLDAGVTVFCSDIGGGPVTCGLVLKGGPAAAPSGAGVVRLDVRQGRGGSEIEEVPDSWTREQLHIHAEEGTLVRLDERVRVTGEATVDDAGGTLVCFVNVDLIERL